MSRHAAIALSMAGSLLLTACGDADEPAKTTERTRFDQRDLPAEPPTGAPPTGANGTPEAPTPDLPPPPPPPAQEPQDSGPDAAAGVKEEIVIQESEVPESKASAFDSNQWDSAVGLGGSAGGRIAGRAGRVARENTESYEGLPPSGFLVVGEAPLSTFGADVDTASFTNVRRLLGEGRLPEVGAVRVEEFVNACRYELPAPGSRETFAFDAEVTACPWEPTHELVRLAVSTRTIDAAKLPPCNLVFLVDVSGSMTNQKKLPLFQRAIGLLVEQLRPQDRVSIVTYADGVSTPLDSAHGSEKGRILAAVQALRAGGSTNGAGGIQRAYDLAMQNRVGGVNRVVLATDGDFNIGIRSPRELEAFIADKRSKGVFLTVLGFGAGNLKEDRLERLANRGDGVYHYIDALPTARRVLVESFGATLMTLAKDVKLQTEWNPKQVARYRLLGYENRALKDVEFRDDTKDGGEVGAGHAVTALYEVERLREATAGDGPLVTLRLRYKPPQGDTSREVAHEVAATTPGRAGAPSANGRTAAVAAALALLLRDDPLAAVTPPLLAELAGGVDGTRNPELVSLVGKACAVIAQGGRDDEPAPRADERDDGTAGNGAPGGR